MLSNSLLSAKLKDDLIELSAAKPLLKITFDEKLLYDFATYNSEEPRKRHLLALRAEVSAALFTAYPWSLEVSRTSYEFKIHSKNE